MARIPDTTVGATAPHGVVTIGRMGLLTAGMCLQVGRKRARDAPARDETIDQRIERAYFYGVISTWDACTPTTIRHRDVAPLALILDIDEEVHKFRRYYTEHRVDNQIIDAVLAMAEADEIVGMIFTFWRSRGYLAS